MIKIYNSVPEHFGIGIKRVAKKLEEYCPESVKFVGAQRNADLVFAHAIGLKEVRDLPANTVLFQYNYLTSDMSPEAWQEVWERTLAVVSYYHLPTTKLVYTPLGADSKEFYWLNIPRNKKIFATGHIAETEHLDTLWEACDALNIPLYHTGGNFRYPRNYVFLNYMSQDRLTRFLNEVEYVACLRAIEGFELLGPEGLFCGVRPIVLDLPCYSEYREFGYTVTEANLKQDLIQVLQQPARPVTMPEMKTIRNKFEWSVIIKNIYEKISQLISRNTAYNLYGE